MSYSDDDLFENNDVVLEPVIETDGDNLQNADNFDRDLHETNPELYEFMRSIKEELRDTDAFSFSFYSNVSCMLLDFANSLCGEYLVDRTNPYTLAAMLPAVEGLNDQSLMVQYIEVRANIVASGRYLRVLENFIAEISDHHLIGKTDTLIDYLSRLWQAEYKLMSSYLTYMIDYYIEFCTKHNLEQEKSITEDQMFPYLSVVEQIKYGQFVQALYLEGIGNVPSAEKVRDEMCSSYATTISNFVKSISESIEEFRTSEDALNV